MTQNTEIKTTTGIDATILNRFDQIDADTASYVEDMSEQGEFATVYGVERVDDTTVRVEVQRCEAGLCETDGDVMTLDVDPDLETRGVAADLANDAPEAAIKKARDYWANWERDD